MRSCACSPRQDEEASLQLIEEALRARVLEELGPGAYRFTHALMQETLLGELSAARQVLLHGQIAEAFEALYGADDRDHLAALANHYAESAVLNREHARTAVRYLRLAAEQSMAALGYDDAARHYERCLAIIEQARDAFGEDEAALWAALAMCRRAVGELRHRADGARAGAGALCGARRCAQRARASALISSKGRVRRNTARSRTTLDTLVTALGDEDSVELCRLLALRGMAELGPEGDAGAARAEAMALRLGLIGSRRSIPAHRLRTGTRLLGAGRVPRGRRAHGCDGGRGGERSCLYAQVHAQHRPRLAPVTSRAGSRAAMSTSLRRGPIAAGAGKRRGVADLAAVAWRRGERDTGGPAARRGRR